MGIGFDVFKANIGWSLADSMMGSISNAIEKNAAEQQARAQAEKEESDKNDMLKTLVFMVGNNIPLDRTGKKAIASVLSEVQDENISLFSIEDKIDAAYSDIQTKNPKQFFANIAAINSDRGQVCLMYLVTLLIYTKLSDDNAALPAHAYNLSLIKHFFGITRTELANCYGALGKQLNKDTDDIADVFEELTSEESIKAIERENPTLVYSETKEALPAPNTSPKEEVEKLYRSTVQGSDSDFTDRFSLADSNPKKAIAAVNAYAKNCKGEEILVFYDDSAFGNGKVVFLLTNKKLYICNSFEKPQEIALADISTISGTEKAAIYVNRIKISTILIKEEKKQLVCEFLEKAIPLAIKINV